MLHEDARAVKALLHDDALFIDLALELAVLALQAAELNGQIVELPCALLQLGFQLLLIRAALMALACLALAVVLFQLLLNGAQLALQGLVDFASLLEVSLELGFVSCQFLEREAVLLGLDGGLRQLSFLLAHLFLQLGGLLLVFVHL